MLDLRAAEEPGAAFPKTAGAGGVLYRTAGRARHVAQTDGWLAKRSEPRLWMPTRGEEWALIRGAPLHPNRRVA